MKIILYFFIFFLAATKCFANEKKKIVVDSAFLHAVIFDISGDFFEIIPIYQIGKSHHFDHIIKPSEILKIKNSDIFVTTGNSGIDFDIFKKNDILIVKIEKKNKHFWLSGSDSLSVYVDIFAKLSKIFDEKTRRNALKVINNIEININKTLCKNHSDIDIFTSHSFNLDIDKRIEINGSLLSESGSILPKSLEYISKKKSCIISDGLISENISKKIHKDSKTISIDADGLFFSSNKYEEKYQGVMYLLYFEKNVKKICDCFN